MSATEEIASALRELDRPELEELLGYLSRGRDALQPPLDAYFGRLAVLAALELDDRQRGLSTLPEPAVLVLLKFLLAERNEAAGRGVKKLWAQAVIEVDDQKRSLWSDRTPGTDPLLDVKLKEMLGVRIFPAEIILDGDDDGSEG